MRGPSGLKGIRPTLTSDPLPLASWLAGLADQLLLRGGRLGREGLQAAGGLLAVAPGDLAAANETQVLLDGDEVLLLLFALLSPGAVDKALDVAAALLGRPPLAALPELVLDVSEARVELQPPLGF